MRHRKPLTESRSEHQKRGLSSQLSLVFLLLLTLLIAPALQGCKAMMYPVARAFGGPKESELKKIRPAFAALKTQAHDGAVIVYRPLVVRAGQPSWDEGAGKLLVEAMHQDFAPRAALASDAPDVSFEPMGHNQMRYLWKRARGYAGWVGSRHPSGDYFVFTELLTDESGERVVGAQCYVVDASGQIAHAQLWNSHHYDPATFSGPGPFLDWMVRDLMKALDEDPMKQYPPYGVG